MGAIQLLMSKDSSENHLVVFPQNRKDSKVAGSSAALTSCGSEACSTCHFLCALVLQINAKAHRPELSWVRLPP